MITVYTSTGYAHVPNAAAARRIMRDDPVATPLGSEALAAGLVPVRRHHGWTVPRG